MYNAAATAAAAVVFILESRYAVKTYLHALSSRYSIISFLFFSFFFFLLAIDRYFRGLLECMLRTLLRNVIEMHRERDNKVITEPSYARSNFFVL